MRKFVLRRVLLMIPVLLGVTFLIFAIMSFTPGDPAAIILGANATPEQIVALRTKLGLDDPFLVRFFNYVKKTSSCTSISASPTSTGVT